MVVPFIDFPCSQTHRGLMHVEKALNLQYAPVLDSSLLCSNHILSIDEVSGSSPVATNSARHSAGEYS